MIPDFTQLMAAHVANDPYTPENLAYASQVASCQRALVYQWRGEPKRPQEPWKDACDQIMFYWGRHADEEFARALAEFGYLVDSQTRVSHLLPPNIGGRLDHIVNFGDGNRIHEHKTIRPDYHASSLPYQAHVWQALWYHMVGRNEYNLVRDPLLTEEPIGGRGGPWVTFQIGVTPELLDELKAVIDVFVGTLRSFEADPTYLPDTLPKVVRQIGETKVVYEVPWNCLPRYCDYCYDEKTDCGPCHPEQGQTLLAEKKRHKEGSQWVSEWIETPAAQTAFFRGLVAVYNAEQVKWKLRATAWRVDGVPVAEIPAIQEVLAQRAQVRQLPLQEQETLPE